MLVQLGIEVLLTIYIIDVHRMHNVSIIRLEHICLHLTTAILLVLAMVGISLMLIIGLRVIIVIVIISTTILV